MNPEKTPKPKRVFYAFFWKAYYRLEKKHKWCIQWKGRRLIVDGFKILVPSETKTRKRNPHAVIHGKASKITIKQRFATIV